MQKSTAILIAIIVILVIVIAYLYNLYAKTADVVDNTHYKNLEVKGKKHTASVLLLTCIDFRFIDNIANFMNKLNYRDDYDQFILAGASLGVNQEKYKAWTRTFWKHLDLAIDLHHIKKVMIVDHEDCGAYKIFYPNVYAESDSETEFGLHKKNLVELANQIKKVHPNLEVEGYFAKLDGTIQRVV